MGIDNVRAVSAATDELRDLVRQWRRFGILTDTQIASALSYELAATIASGYRKAGLTHDDARHAVDDHGIAMKRQIARFGERDHP